MLTVLMVEQDEGTLRVVREVCDAVGNPDAVSLVHRKLSDAAALPETGDEAFLVFVEATHDNAPLQKKKNGDARRWLEALTGAAADKLVRVVVVSTSAQFHAEESRFAWLTFPILTGYEVVGGTGEALRLAREEMRATVERLLEGARDRFYDSERQFDLGHWLTLPAAIDPKNAAEVYRRHRFASFLVGGMADTLRELQRIQRIVEDAAPPLDLSTHPTRKGVQACFEELVKTNKDGKNPPSWYTEARAKFSATLIAPHLLLLGQTGSGKTMLAREMHRMRFKYDGLREDDKALVDRLFVEVNCAALGPNLAAGEIFGGLKGAWSGMEGHVPGAIFSALGGTLFLDEFGELPETVQTMLLTYMDTGAYYPVGGYSSRIEAPTLVIAATNRPLEEWARAGGFRRDLLERFRLRLRLPSLRERRAYLPQLCDFVLQDPQINPERAVTAVSHRALRKLEGHTWPGNFRELQQVLWRAAYQARLDGLCCIRGRHIVFSTDL